MKDKFIIGAIIASLAIALYFVIIDNLEIAFIAILVNNGLLLFTNNEKEI